jgi:hypothetical protein
MSDSKIVVAESINSKNIFLFVEDNIGMDGSKIIFMDFLQNMKSILKEKKVIFSLELSLNKLTKYTFHISTMSICQNSHNSQADKNKSYQELNSVASKSKRKKKDWLRSVLSILQ